MQENPTVQSELLWSLQIGRNADAIRPSLPRFLVSLHRILVTYFKPRGIIAPVKTYASTAGASLPLFHFKGQKYPVVPELNFTLSLKGRSLRRQVRAAVRLLPAS